MEEAISTSRGLGEGYDVVYQKTYGKEQSKIGVPVVPVVPVVFIFNIFKGVPHLKNEKAKVNAIEKVGDDHSIDFDVDLLSEVGKEPVFICFPYYMSSVRPPFLDRFRPYKEEVCI